MVRRLHITILIALTVTGCSTFSGNRRSSSLPHNPLPNAPVALSPEASRSCRLWRYSLHSHISHISVSRDGKYVLASTSSEAAAQDARIRLLSNRGTLLWSHGLAQAVKAQAISDGIIAISSYDNKLHVYNTDGKELWTREHLGRPLILSKSKRIVLLNDDDSEPETAFVSYDYEGRHKAIVQLPTNSDGKSEPLDMFASGDDSFIVVTTMNNAFYGYTPDGKLLWKGKASRDIVTVAAAGGSNPHVYVITAKDLTAYATNTQSGLVQPVLIWNKSLDRKYEAARLTGGAKPILFLYGNTHNGQSFAAHDAENGTELWRRSYPAPANFSSQVFLSMAHQPYMTAAVDNGEQPGLLHVMGINARGLALFDTPVNSGDGIYSYALADSAQALAVGTGDPGDGVLEYYRLKAGSCQ